MGANSSKKIQFLCEIARAPISDLSQIFGKTAFRGFWAVLMVLIKGNERIILNIS